MDKIPMTAAGYSVLENELKHRQQVERPRIIAQITDARSHGAAGRVCLGVDRR